MKTIKKTILATALLAVSATAMASQETVTVEVLIVDKIKGLELPSKKLIDAGNTQDIIDFYNDQQRLMDYDKFENIPLSTGRKITLNNEYNFGYEGKPYRRNGKYTIELENNGSIDIDINFKAIDKVGRSRLTVKEYSDSDNMNKYTDSFTTEFHLRDIDLTERVYKVEDEEENDVSFEINDKIHYLIVNRK